MTESLTVNIIFGICFDKIFCQINFDPNLKHSVTNNTINQSNFGYTYFTPVRKNKIFDGNKALPWVFRC